MDDSYSKGNIGANPLDRSIGESWEKYYITASELLSVESVHTTRIDGNTTIIDGVQYFNPDVTQFFNDLIWLTEVKHKVPAKNGCYGIEDYRLNGTNRTRGLFQLAEAKRNKGEKIGGVLYAIHDYSTNGKSAMTNRLVDWRIANLEKIHQFARSGQFFTLFNRQTTNEPVVGWYYDKRRFIRPDVFFAKPYPITEIHQKMNITCFIGQSHLLPGMNSQKLNDILESHLGLKTWAQATKADLREICNRILDEVRDYIRGI